MAGSLRTRFTWRTTTTSGDLRKRIKQALFEMLCLEGQQARLSWITVLKKRENYRRAFHNFDPQAVGLMDEQDLARLMQDSGLIRHAGKLTAIMTNAHAYLAMEAKGEDFARFVWSFVNN